MKRLFKILPLCMAIVLAFAGASFAKTNTRATSKLDKTPINTIKNLRKGCLYLLRDELDPAGKCDSVIKSYESSTDAKALACTGAGKDETDPLCKANTESANNAKQAMEDCLNNNNDGKFIKVLNIIKDTITGVFKVQVTINKTSTKTNPFSPFEGGGLPPDYAPPDIVPVNPDDEPWYEWYDLP